MTIRRNFAVSRLVNPTGATPVLSEEQVWKGLAIKSRDPKQFLAAFSKSEVVIESDTGDKVVREVRFNSNREPLREEILLYEPTIVYFDSPDGAKRITTLISYNEDNEMVLTFSFIGGTPSQVDNASIPEINEIVGRVVSSTVDSDITDSCRWTLKVIGYDRVSDISE